MSVTPSLRRATDADLDALYPMYMDPETNPYLSFEVTPRDAFDAIWAELCTAGTPWVWVEGGEVVASAFTNRWGRRLAHMVTIGTVAVRRDRWGQGIGAALMRAVIDEARQMEGVERVDVWVEADNPRALRLYERLGFEREAVLRGFVKRAGEALVDEVVLVMWV